MKRVFSAISLLMIMHAIISAGRLFEIFVWKNAIVKIEYVSPLNYKNQYKQLSFAKALRSQVFKALNYKLSNLLKRLSSIYLSELSFLKISTQRKLYFQFLPFTIQYQLLPFRTCRSFQPEIN